MKHRRHNVTGRSTGHFTRAIADALKPTPPFAWLTRELIESDALRGLSVNARRFLDFLINEQFANAALENGRLKAPYDQLVAWGLTRECIPAAIEAAIAAGLVRRTGPRILRVATTYRLTFYATVNDGVAIPPTNEWKRADAPEKGVEENQKSGAVSRTNLVRNPEPDRTVADSNEPTKARKSAISSPTNLVRNPALPSISTVGKGATASTRKPGERG